ncbi:MFS transporter [Clostridium paraputrificum]|uniref:MFS transporter n=1 Tax=Clostridium paraputrificum TaxID=29363 RepID=UPI003D338F5E
MSFLNLFEKKENQVKGFNMGDKIGYALGDVGCGMIFQLITTYLMLFYTDILGISPAAVGTLFVVARIWDAINDPIMGLIVDRNNHTKFGKFRPYLILFGIPMTIAGILCFTFIPSIPQSMKVPYAYVTYIIFGMLYTAVNIPYGSLSSVMTSDPVERTSLSTFRNIGSLISGVAVMVLVPNIIFTDGVVTARGFLICAIIFAIICSISFIFTFRLTRERIHFKKSTEEKVTLSQTVKTLLKNRAFIGVTLASFALSAAMFTGMSLNTYLFKEYFHKPELITLAGMAGMIPMLFVMPLVGSLVKKFGKKEVSIVGTVLATVVYGILWILPITNPYVFISLTMIGGIGTGIVSVLTWALVADAIDYQEYISGERSEGLVYSSYSLFRKLAQAIAGGVGGFALGILGYEAGVTEQAVEVGIGIKNIMCGAYFVGLGLSLVALLFIFNLSKKKLAEVNESLKTMRENR